MSKDGLSASPWSVVYRVGHWISAMVGTDEWSKCMPDRSDSRSLDRRTVLSLGVDPVLVDENQGTGTKKKERDKMHCDGGGGG